MLSVTLQIVAHKIVYNNLQGIIASLVILVDLIGVEPMSHLSYKCLLAIYTVKAHILVEHWSTISADFRIASAVTTP